jgi:RNA polymerase sigma factor (TIGR02999 family)
MASDLIHVDARVIEAVYPELRAMAGNLMTRERQGHILQRTALVNECFIRLFGNCPSGTISTGNFLAPAAHQMRHILIEHARREAAQKRGNRTVHVPLSEGDGTIEPVEDEWLALDQVLDRLGGIDKRALSVVELRFFCGYTTLETAGILGVSGGTVESDWQFARSWLLRALRTAAREHA